MDIKFAVVGPATKKAVENRGIFTNYMPEEYYGEKMAEGLSKLISDDDKVMVCVPREIDSELVENLKEHTKQMDIIPVYDVVYEKNNEFMIEKSDFVVFTSASTVKGFVNTMEHLDYTSVNAICIGKMTAKEAKKYEMKVSVSEEATIESLVECVIECSKRGFE